MRYGRLCCATRVPRLMEPGDPSCAAAAAALADGAKREGRREKERRAKDGEGRQRRAEPMLVVLPRIQRSGRFCGRPGGVSGTRGSTFCLGDVGKPVPRRSRLPTRCLRGGCACSANWNRAHRHCGARLVERLRRMEAQVPLRHRGASSSRAFPRRFSQAIAGTGRPVHADVAGWRSGRSRTACALELVEPPVSTASPRSSCPANSACTVGFWTSSTRPNRDPLRIEFYGDEIESIRRFDPATQLHGSRNMPWKPV